MRRVRRDGLGGPALKGDFDGARGRFRFRVSGPLRPARPWINVLANPLFGAQISEAGTGYTWAGNSQLHQLTAWSNDPVTDSNSEAFFVQDMRSREVWNMGAGNGSAEATYTVEHEQGSTTIAHRRGEVEISATWCVDTCTVDQTRRAWSCTTRERERSGCGWSESSNGSWARAGLIAARCGRRSRRSHPRVTVRCGSMRCSRRSVTATRASAAARRSS